MSDLDRLLVKLDGAHHALKHRRREGHPEGSLMCEAFRRECVRASTFEVTIGRRRFEVKRDRVRVSKTTIDLGIPGSGPDGVIRLLSVTNCVHGTCEDGAEKWGLGILRPDDAIVPIVIG